MEKNKPIIQSIVRAHVAIPEASPHGKHLTVLVADTASTVILTNTGEILGEHKPGRHEGLPSQKKKSPAQAEDHS